MDICIYNQSEKPEWDNYLNDFKLIGNQTFQLLKLKKNYVFSVVFVDVEQIKAINNQYRHINKSTDVISFALLDNDNSYINEDVEIELGDIFINVHAVVTQASSYGHSQRREVCFLFVHGLLHLLGYDHQNGDDEKVMFTLQEDILNEIVSR